MKQMLLSVRSIKKKKVKEFSELCASFRHLVVLEIREVSSEHKKNNLALLLLLHNAKVIPGDALVQGQLQHECEREDGGYY